MTSAAESMPPVAARSWSRTAGPIYARYPGTQAQENRHGEISARLKEARSWNERASEDVSRFARDLVVQELRTTLTRAGRCSWIEINACMYPPTERSGYIREVPKNRASRVNPNSNPVQLLASGAQKS
jgi:hypothetical protein